MKGVKKWYSNLILYSFLWTIVFDNSACDAVVLGSCWKYDGAKIQSFKNRTAQKTIEDPAYDCIAHIPVQNFCNKIRYNWTVPLSCRTNLHFAGFRKNITRSRRAVRAYDKEKEKQHWKRPLASYHGNGHQCALQHSLHMNVLHCHCLVFSQHHM